MKLSVINFSNYQAKSLIGLMIFFTRRNHDLRQNQVSGADYLSNDTTLELVFRCRNKIKNLGDAGFLEILVG